MESAIDAVSEFFLSLPVWINVATTLVTAASAVTAVTPTPADDRLVGKLYRLIEIVAINVGRAKDKPSGPGFGGALGR